MHRIFLRLILSLVLVCPAAADEVPVAQPDDLPDLDETYVVGEVTLDKEQIFDLSDPEEDKWLYRLANRLHYNTRDKTIQKQLLFRSGDAYDKRVIEESARILRNNKYLYDANVRATRVADGTVDLLVTTRDVWSLQPEVSVSRSGGETRTRFGLEEFNLLGRGQMLRVLRDNDIDRSENTIEFTDRHLGRSWVSLAALYSDNSDGHRSQFTVTRPFFALDTRWAAGVSMLSEDKRSKLYQFGAAAAAYRHDRDFFQLFGGWSQGIRNGRVLRWTAGVVHDNNQFSASPLSSLPSVLPEDRKLVYPFLGLEIVEDGFVTAHNRDQIERTEDFQMGLQLRAAVGWADSSYGSDRDAAVFSANVSRGIGSLGATALLLSAGTYGRVESGDLTNALASFRARFFRRQSEKRTFYIGLSGTVGTRLDLDNPVEIGGDRGLRGYPLRYQAGDSKLLATIEQRYYTDWYPYRFARIGGAIFADAGRVWGSNPLGPDNRGWATNVGIGLRIALTRLTERVIHLDLAFPLNGDDTIDDVQILLDARKGF